MRAAAREPAEAEALTLEISLRDTCAGALRRAMAEALREVADELEFGPDADPYDGEEDIDYGPESVGG